MKSRIARRMQNLVQSDIRRLTIECDKVGGINLGQGICDLPTHPLVKQGAIEAIQGGKAIYTHARGLIELRRKVSEKLKQFNCLEYDPDTELCITVGSSGAFACSVLATLNPGDEVILVEPFYGYHLNTLLMAGITPRYARMDLATMTLDRSSFESAISERTRGIVVCTPSNPGGMVYSRADLEWLAGLAVKHDLLVYSDEIYEYITYDGLKHVSAATVPGLRERTMTLGGYSKTFSITGWRIGYLAAPADIMDKAAVASDLLYICAPHPLQRGVLKGLDAPASFYEEMRQDYEAGRKMICEALEAGGFKPYWPKGSYYVMADFSAHGWEDDQQAAMELLQRAKVAAIPGSAFYEPGSGRGSRQLRFCYAKEHAVLEEACKRIRALK
ncbi:MAG: pyridoxal phosphate-dependent aminotransferase [Planctomycetes bacterium]|nr:pyridoxal phosphate-dependent aminotransferase [Planctomycetota bacterium]MCB9936391.1 pyridoxal phosphate-dependent aminotransferase [Planctomycetota bacterium]